MTPELWTKTKLFDLYRPTEHPQRLVMINPGWLGENTLQQDIVERAVGELDIAVAVVRQRPLHRPKTFHRATKHAVEAVEITDVEVVDHSLGHFDVVEAIKHHQDKDTNYRIAKMTAVDGVGTNGQHINIGALLEVVNMTFDREAHHVVLDSVVNWLKKPLPHNYEAFRAVFASGTNHQLDIACRDAGVELDYVFHDQDRVIRTPSDKDVTILEHRGSRVVVHDGGHLNATSRPDTLRAILRAD